MEQGKQGRVHVSPINKGGTDLAIIDLSAYPEETAITMKFNQAVCQFQKWILRRIF